MTVKLFLISFLLVSGKQLFGQDSPYREVKDDTLYTLDISKSFNYVKGDSLYVINGSLEVICKNPGVLQVDYYRIVKEKSPLVEHAPASPFIKIHGNILYNFNYRSYIDTPFAQDDLMQHFLQSNFSVLIKDKYPVLVIVSTRLSNSPYFKNTFDVNLKFSKGQLLENIKNDYRNNLSVIRNAVTGVVQKGEGLNPKDLNASKFMHLVNIDQLSELSQLLKKDKERITAIESWINSAARLQEIVEKKEKVLRSDTSGMNTSVEDKVEKLLGKGNSFADLLSGKTGWKAELPKVILSGLDSAKAELGKLKDTVKQEAGKLQREQKKIEDSLNVIKKELASLTSGPGLYAFMKKYGLDKGQLSGAQRLLLSVNQVGIGRNYIDYSELTVKNISIAGINVELNPLPFYFAFAAGKVNYLMRDFIYKNDQNQLPSQSVALLRAGIGQKDKNNIIFSFYKGKKSVLNSSSVTTLNPVQQISGISAESRVSLDPDNYIIAEFAKSSYYSPAQLPTSSDPGNKIFNFKDRSNEAYSIKLSGRLQSTDTKFSGYYKNLGEHFQSFTLYPTGVNQEAWLARINQSLWKKEITIDAAIRKNDFVSPIAAPSFNSSAVFKSIQVMARFPKYPIVSFGYYPSSQLVLSNNNTLMESQYNTLNTIVSYSYRLNKTGLNTNAMFTQFYNSSSDTGFIYYNAASWTVNQSAFLGKLTLQTSAGLTDQKYLRLFTLEQSLSLQLKANFSFGGSIKWNRVEKVEDLFGGSATMNIKIRRLGSFQFNYEKTYLPGENRNLRPVDMGRMSFYREF